MKIKIGKLNINYICCGEGKPLVIIHGWGCNIGVYDALIKHLSKNHTVYALDLPGFGESDEPESPWSVSDYADFMCEFLTKLGIDNPILFGHSFGGRVIIKLLTCGYPVSAEKVILTGSAGILRKKTAVKKLRAAIVRVAKRFFESKIIKKLLPTAAEKLKRRYGSPDYVNSTPVMRGTLVKTVNEDLTPLLENMTAETLLIWGANDTETPLADGQLMEKLMKNAGLAVIHNAGHYAFLEQRVQFTNILNVFLK